MVGKRLKEVRINKGLTQVAIANVLSVSQTNYNRYEKGVVEPNIQFLQSFSREFNVNLNWLLTGQGEMFLDSPGQPPAKPPKNPKKDPEEQLAQLKKSVSDLEQRNTHLQTENQRLNRKLIGCLEELLFYHKTYPKTNDK